MRQIYSLFKTTFLVLALFGIHQAGAQGSTTVTTSTECLVVQNFSTPNSGFTSASLYSDQYDYEFVHKVAGTNGYLESSDEADFAPYQASLISPIYLNTNLNGMAVVGFSYTAPAGTLYRIRIIRPNLATGGADILATSSQGPPIAGGNPNWRALPGTSGNICLQLNDVELITGQPLRYEVVFYVTSTAAPVTFDNFALNSLAPSPLPVQFMGVVATQTATGVDVRWDVAEEIDVKEYQLERSTDGSSFTTVKTVSADRKTVYGTTDVSAKAAVVYYRVKSVDFDGSLKYSGIVRLVNGTTSGKLKVYPSPAISQVTIQHKQLEAGAKITVSAADGRIVKALTPARGLSNTMVDISSLPAGMYMVRVDYGNGKVETTSFLKQ